MAKEWTNEWMTGTEVQEQIRIHIRQWHIIKPTNQNSKEEMNYSFGNLTIISYPFGRK